MRNLFSTKNLFSLAGLTAIAIATQQEAVPTEAERGLILVPHIINTASELDGVASAIVIYDPVDGRRVNVERIQVSSPDGVLIEQEIGAALLGDPRFGELGSIIERLPHEIAHVQGRQRHFSDEREGFFLGHEIEEKIHTAEALLEQLRREWSDGLELPMTEEHFVIQLGELFSEDGPLGEEIEITVSATWTTPGQAQRTSTTTALITRAPLALDPPASFIQAMGAASIQRGDMHVHTCHGESLGACAPSGNCTAESFQVTGSFTLAELKSQFIALGSSWYTVTDHSYCINDDAEYQAIVNECASASDPSFLCLPHLELSSDEEGSQTGSDLADILCLGLTSANHMGAHGINSRIPGGGDGFLGFCDGLFSDVLTPYSQNIATVNAQGGFAIANHPTAGTFGWESYDSTAGQEGGGLHGVEIWNGGAQTGQGAAVGRWIEWLLDGRILYAYSGSDTHSQAVAYGANCVLFNGEDFTPGNLNELLKKGRLYISDGPVLIGDVVIGGQPLSMGTVQTLPPNPPATSINSRAHYNFGSSTGTITLFRGRVGDANETVLAQSGALTGEGVFEFSHSLDLSARTWYRSYAETNGGTAYGNPVFFQPSASDPTTYCNSTPIAQGCSNEISFAGAPSATSSSPFVITASPAPSNRNGIFFYGLSPAFTPFNAGTLCVQPPIKRTGVQNSGGNPPPVNCSGEFSFDFNALIGSGLDPQLGAGVTVYGQFWFRSPGDPGNSAMTQAAAFTIQP